MSRLPLRATRLVALVLKCAIKPITNRLMNAAKNNAFIRQNICLPAANFFNKYERKLKLKLEGYNEAITMYIPKMEEGKAMELVADIAGEAIILFLGVLLLRFEKQRNLNNTKALIASEQVNELEKLNVILEMIETHNIQIKDIYEKLKQFS